MNKKLFFLTFLICISGCDIVSDQNSLNIAKYGDTYLSKEEFVMMMGGVKKEDSVLRKKCPWLTFRLAEGGCS